MNMEEKKQEMKPDAGDEKRGNTAVAWYYVENVFICQTHTAPFPLADNAQGKQAFAVAVS